MGIPPAVGVSWMKEQKVAAVRVVTGEAMEGLEFVTV